MASRSSSRARWRVVDHLLPIFFLLFLVAPASCFSGSSSKQLTLERAFPVGEELETVRSRDRARHSRLLQQRLPGGGTPSGANPGVVDFSVEGSSNPFTVGLYYTRVKLGNPAKEFYVQIDTGSDVLWVNCNPCNGCPTTSGLNIELDFFDPQRSSSASVISCSDQRCNYGFQPSEADCATSSRGSLCGYSFQYGDGSGTSGFYVSDTMHFEMFVANGMVANTSANIIFGCSDSQSGDLTKPDRAVDGIFGFGQHDLSVISQLSSLGVAPKVFSHCLKGSENGGGILVLGEIIEPGIVYTPLVKYQPHYNLNLQSIAVNGRILPIDSSVFATSTTQGTIIDSGTTLAYLAEQAYDPFIRAIIDSVAQSVHPVVSKENQCFLTSNRAEDVFPAVTLNFEGRASLFLKPQDYLLQQGSVDNALIWCIGWQKNQGQSVTILGDLVLKDKIFVYDLAAQRIGWVNYDCSLSVNVSASQGRSEFLNTGQYSVSDSSHTTLPRLIFFVTAIFHLYISFFSTFLL